jgi:hypothetical protein
VTKRWNGGMWGLALGMTLLAACGSQDAPPASSDDAQGQAAQKQPDAATSTSEDGAAPTPTTPASDGCDGVAGVDARVFPFA